MIVFGVPEVAEQRPTVTIYSCGVRLRLWCRVTSYCSSSQLQLQSTGTVRVLYCCGLWMRSAAATTTVRGYGLVLQSQSTLTACDYGLQLRPTGPQPPAASRQQPPSPSRYTTFPPVFRPSAGPGVRTDGRTEDGRRNRHCLELLDIYIYICIYIYT